MASEKKVSLCEMLECPVCLDYLEKPIRQCSIGHSFCTKCIDPQNIKSCPECRSTISDTRNYKLEELLDSIDFPCENKKNGCPYMLKKDQLSDHALECKYRKLKCEGRFFCDWACNFEGYNLLEHFKSKHSNHAALEFNGTVTIAFNDKTDFADLQLVYAHYQLFWLKHKIDIKKGRAYWAFQLIGPKRQALNYYYEFEFFKNPPSICKYKITEYCLSDVTDINEIFESEKCVAISLKTLKNYIDDKNMYLFRFRLMKIRKDDKEKPQRSASVSSSYTKGKPLPGSTGRPKQRK